MNDGVHQMARDEYDRVSRQNFSTLKHLAKSPAHFRAALLEKFEDTDAKKRGRVTHLATFEPEKFLSDVAVFDGRRAGKDWEAFQKKNAGRELITEGMYESAMEIATAARTNADAMKYLSRGLGESTVLWTHERPAVESFPAWSLQCKGRLDFIADAGAITDLKTTKDGSPEGFAREVMRYGYHAQAAWYVDGYEAATQRRLGYVIVAVEVAPPHVVTVYRVPDEVLKIGRDLYRGWLDTLMACRKANAWPAYATGEVTLTLPAWAMPQNDDDEDGSGLGLIIGG